MAIACFAQYENRLSCRIPRIGRGVQGDLRFLSVSHQADTFFLSKDKIDLVCCVLRDVVRDVWICYGELPGSFCYLGSFFK